MNTSLPIPAAPSHESNGAALTPLESIRVWSAEDKESVLLALLQEAVQYNGETGLLPIDDKHGKSLGYYVPPKAAEEHFRSLAPILSPNQREVTLHALADLGKTFDIKSFLTELREEDAKPG